MIDTHVRSCARGARRGRLCLPACASSTSRWPRAPSTWSASSTTALRSPAPSSSGAARRGRGATLRFSPSAPTTTRSARKSLRRSSCVALLTARGGVDAAVDIGVRRSAPPSVDGALRSFGDEEAVRYVGDGVGSGLTLKSNVGGPVQESHLKAAVAAAELALLGGVAPPPAASRAQRSTRRRTEDLLECALPREGEPVLVWEDKASCESVEQSGFFLATCRDVDVQLGEVGGTATSKSRHLDSTVHRVKVQWEAGHDRGSSTFYLSTELCLCDAARRRRPRDGPLVRRARASRTAGRTSEKGISGCLAVEVGGVGWDELLAEHDRPPPELLLSWVASAFEATPKILFARAVKAWRRRQHAMDLPAVPRKLPSIATTRPSPSSSSSRASAAREGGAQPRHASRRRRQRPSEGVAEHVQGEERLRRRRVPVPEDARGWSVPLRRAAQRRVLRGRLSPVAVPDRATLQRWLNALGLGMRVHWASPGSTARPSPTWAAANATRRTTSWAPIRKCYHANLYVQHMAAMMYLLRSIYQHTALLIENPEAKLFHHPLMRHVVARGVDDGGSRARADLGRMRATSTTDGRRRRRRAG